MIYKQRYGYYTREVLDSSKGKVIEIDEYGRMKAELEKIRIIWKFNPEDLTRIVFLSPKELEKKQIELEEQMEEQERMKAERREEKEDE